MTDLEPPVSLEQRPPAVSVRLEVLKKRSDFIAASRARRHGTPGIHLQARPRGDDGPWRVGFTCSKKLGNAVARNHAKRRLRALAQLVLPQHGRAGWDYVLVGRAGVTSSLPFAQLQTDLERALKAIHP